MLVMAPQLALDVLDSTNIDQDMALVLNEASLASYLCSKVTIQTSPEEAAQVSILYGVLLLVLHLFIVIDWVCTRFWGPSTMTELPS